MADPIPVKPITSEAILILLLISVLAFAAGILILCCKRLLNRNGLPFEKRGLPALLCLLLAVFLVRYTTGRSGLMEYGLLGVVEEGFNSLLHSFQSFTMDEGYTEYLSAGKEMISRLTDSPFLIGAYAFYVSVLNAACALSGGAVLLTIIANLFPRLKLFLSTRFTRRHICCFSESGPESAALAESIRQCAPGREKLKNALLIFCNAGPDAPPESLEQARRLGALLTDISLPELNLKPSAAGRTFFLTGSDDSNLNVLSSLSRETDTARFAGNDAIYVFANDHYGNLLEKSVRSRINDRIRAEGGSDPGRITLFSVNRYRSQVYQLIKTHPLFEALPEDSKELRIAIFGSGRIGTEMFLSACWCGQMADRRLKITVISEEDRTSFEKRIDHVSSEILRMSAQTPDPKLLEIGPRLGTADCYFSYEYIQSDVYRDGLEQILTAERPAPQNGRLADFDYFVVALGSDRRNMETAEQIGRTVTVKSTAVRPSGVRVPIACAIWNDEMNAALQQMEEAGFDRVDIIPFGSMRSSFDIRTVLLEEVRDRAEKIRDMYEQRIAAGLSRSKKIEEDPYAYWANVARAIHTQYKAASLGLSAADRAETPTELYLKMCRFLSLVSGIRSLLEKTGTEPEPGTEAADRLRRLTESAEADYASLQALSSCRPGPETLSGIRTYLEHCHQAVLAAGAFLSGASPAEVRSLLKASEAEFPAVFHRLAWLEHRRWCAFMRTEGFRCPTLSEEAAYIGRLPDGRNAGRHKDLTLLLHPCLVECDQNGLRPDLLSCPEEELDNLDLASRRFLTLPAYASKGLETYDFKIYDYPEYEF